MNRPVTLMTSQWGDMEFEKLCQLASRIGYDGLEINCGSHFDVEKAANSRSYCEEIQHILSVNKLKSWALASHVIGQCVGDKWDPRLDNFAPNRLSGKPEDIKKWAVETMLMVPHAASNMGIDVVTGFMGSPIWAYWYSFPQTTNQMIDEGFAEIVNLWSPILDEFDKCQVKFALEVHPTEIAFDYYTAERLLKEFDSREALGFNFDPSHLLWQGCDPVIFLRDFVDKIYHVHMKDISVKNDGKAGILGSFLTFGDTRRAWNFRSLGHGDVNFEEIIRELNRFAYQGPLSVEWEDSGMERIYGATEACQFVRSMDFKPSDFAFDKAIANK